MEKYLIRHCAPTLASLKPANLFRCFGNGAELRAKARVLEEELLPKGLRLRVLQEMADSALLYLYRPSQLEAYLMRPEVDVFLTGQGYLAASLEERLEHLAARMREEGGFPHEIGIFLGYPLEDVEGFIRYEGKESRYTGYWKVYGDVTQAKQIFQAYDDAKECAVMEYMAGKHMSEIAC